MESELIQDLYLCCQALLKRGMCATDPLIAAAAYLTERRLSLTQAGPVIQQIDQTDADILNTFGWGQNAQSAHEGER